MQEPQIDAIDPERIRQIEEQVRNGVQQVGFTVSDRLPPKPPTPVIESTREGMRVEALTDDIIEAGMLAKLDFIRRPINKPPQRDPRAEQAHERRHLQKLQHKKAVQRKMARASKRRNRAK